MKVGLVLEGGAMRGMYTSGVLDIFLDNGIKVDMIVGVSAGALFGVNYVSKQRGRSIRYTKKYIADNRYMGIKSLIKTRNFVNKEFAYYKVPKELDVFDQKEYSKSNIDFYATVTNIESGEAEYIKVTDVFEQMEVLRATSALPFISEIIEIDGKKYLDGGISESIPFEFLRKSGCDKIILILTRPFNYKKKKTGELKFKLFYRNYPNMIKRIVNRHENYNDSIKNIITMEKNKEIFVIRPSEEISIKRLEKNTEKLEEVYQLGLKDGSLSIKNLCDFLK